MPDEPTPQPLPAPRPYNPAQSWFFEHKKALSYVGIIGLLAFFAWGHHSTVSSQPKPVQKTTDTGTGDNNGGKSDQKQGSGKRRESTDYGTTRRTVEKSRFQVAQEDLRYHSLYGQGFVLQPINNKGENVGQVGQPNVDRTNSENPINKSEATTAPSSGESGSGSGAPKKPRTSLDFASNVPTVTVPEGTVIEMALDNKLEGEMNGEVICHVTTDFYHINEDGTSLLVLPKGTRVLGQASHVSNYGQQRLAIAFHRAIVFRKNGSVLWSIPLAPDEPGLDQQGATGIHGKVNNHIVSTILASMAVGLIGAAATSIGFGYGDSGSQVVLTGFGNGMAQSAGQLMTRLSNRLPTHTVPPGDRVKILTILDKTMPIYPTEEL